MSDWSSHTCALCVPVGTRRETVAVTITWWWDDFHSWREIPYVWIFKTVTLGHQCVLCILTVRFLRLTQILPRKSSSRSNYLHDAGSLITLSLVPCLSHGSACSVLVLPLRGCPAVGKGFRARNAHVPSPFRHLVAMRLQLLYLTSLEFNFSLLLFG